MLRWAMLTLLVIFQTHLPLRCTGKPKARNFTQPPQMVFRKLATSEGPWEGRLGLAFPVLCIDRPSQLFTVVTISEGTVEIIHGTAALFS